eukprot:9500725-Pyramimonas_sp.AAC.1
MPTRTMQRRCTHMHAINSDMVSSAMIHGLSRTIARYLTSACPACNKSVPYTWTPPVVSSICTANSSNTPVSAALKLIFPPWCKDKSGTCFLEPRDFKVMYPIRFECGTQEPSLSNHLAISSDSLLAPSSTLAIPVPLQRQGLAAITRHKHADVYRCTGP